MICHGPSKPVTWWLFLWVYVALKTSSSCKRSQLYRQNAEHFLVSRSKYKHVRKCYRNFCFQKLHTFQMTHQNTRAVASSVLQHITCGTLPAKVDRWLQNGDEVGSMSKIVTPVWYWKCKCTPHVPINSCNYRNSILFLGSMPIHLAQSCFW